MSCSAGVCRVAGSRWWARSPGVDHCRRGGSNWRAACSAQSNVGRGCDAHARPLERQGPLWMEESVAQCSVLRCNGRSEGMFMYFQSPNTSTPVCVQHQERIDAGEPWLFDAADKRMHMGEDVGALIVGQPRSSRDTSMSSHGPVYKLTMERADGEQTTLVLTTDAFRQLSEAWTITGQGYKETYGSGDLEE